MVVGFGVEEGIVPAVEKEEVKAVGRERSGRREVSHWPTIVSERPEEYAGAVSKRWIPCAVAKSIIATEAALSISRPKVTQPRPMAHGEESARGFTTMKEPLSRVHYFAV